VICSPFEAAIANNSRDYKTACLLSCHRVDFGRGSFYPCHPINPFTSPPVTAKKLDNMSDEMDDPTNIEYRQEMIDSKSEEPPTKKRRRSAKPNSDRKFECKHEGCGKSYSRAEHLYRHQLNRKLITLGALPFLTILQTLQRTFIGVTIRIVIDISSDKISVFDIEKDTPLMAPSYTKGMAMLKQWQIRTTYLRHLRKCLLRVPALRN
jgi:hypothetical protein